MRGSTTTVGGTIRRHSRSSDTPADVPFRDWRARPTVTSSSRLTPPIPVFSRHEIAKCAHQWSLITPVSLPPQPSISFSPVSDANLPLHCGNCLLWVRLFIQTARIHINHKAHCTQTRSYMHITYCINIGPLCYRLRIL